MDERAGVEITLATEYPPLRIAQSEALRSDSRESTANPPPQSFALRNPEARNPQGREGEKGPGIFFSRSPRISD